MPEQPAPRTLDPRGDSAAANLLARAFWDDPVMVHLLPHGPSRYRRLVRFYGFALRDGRRRGLVEADHDGAAVTVWHAPGHRQVTATDVARAVPMGVGVYGLRRLPHALRTLQTIEQGHPHEPHWYLALIASDPVRRGTGAAGGLLRDALERADDEGMPAYLESSKLTNVAYYERFGFGVTEELRLPDDGPPMWRMWRDPTTG